MATRAASLIGLVLLLAGCGRADAASATATPGCLRCHERHHEAWGACTDCHRGEPRASRAELAHARLLTGPAATHRLPDSPVVREGRSLVESLACRRCHEIAGEGNNLATSLDGVVWKRDQAPLVEALVSPADNMPRFGLDEPQALAAMAFLLHATPRAGARDAYRVLFDRVSTAGPEGFEKVCGGCHRLLSAGGPLGTGRDGPNLSGLFTRFYPRSAPGDRAWSDEALREWVANPRAGRPFAAMPPVSLTAAELRDVRRDLGAADR